MAVVTLKSDLFRDEIAGAALPDSVEQRGRFYTAQFSVANGATDSSGSKYRLASIPSHAILHHDTYFDVGAWGFLDMRIGTETDVAALVSALVSAGDQQPIAQSDATKFKKRLWETLGLASDPGGSIDIYAHAIANATGAGTLTGFIAYYDD